MKRNIKENKYFRWGLTAFVVIAVALLCNQIMTNWGQVADFSGMLAGALRPIIMGLIIAYVLNPLLKVYEKYLFGKLFGKMLKKKPKAARRLTRIFGVVFALITALAIVSGLMLLIIPELYVNINRLITSFPGYVENVIAFLTELSKEHPELVNPIIDYFSVASQDLIAWVRDGVLPNANQFIAELSMGIYGTFRAILDLIIGVIVAIYVLGSKERYAAGARKFIYSLFKKERAQKVIALAAYTDDHFGGFLVGKVLDSAIIGVLSFIVFSIFNIPYTLLVSVFVGVTNVIPFFGPFLGAIPSMLLILLVNPWKALIFGVLILAIQQLDGNVIGPKILGNKTGLDSFAVIFSILIFGGLFGIPGMIVGVPVFATVWGIVVAVCDKSLERKKLPTDIEAYGHGKVIEETVKTENTEE
ncbi:MAG: AI-2E family transporter [Clostridia bacterium]|nr:AI-2E family transporter [Clostridia bacterium]